jgi:allophanate hydrolase
MVSIQDAGRQGHLRYGVCASGPMDRFAYACAVAAVDSEPDSAVIEISLGGLILECVSGELTIALAGACFSVSLNNQRLSPWCVATLGPGDVLSVRAGDWGSFSYLGFAGQLQCTTWLKSCATHTLSGFGGGSLSQGQELVIDSTVVLHNREGSLSIPEFAQPLHQLQVVKGPQDKYFTEQSIHDFFNTTYTLSAAYDRMGVLLDGQKLSMQDALSIPSEPVLRGSVQVSGEGSPTVLLADHQTTGGYPKIATLVSTGADRLAQLRSRQSVNFQCVRADEAVQICREASASRADYIAQLKQPRDTLENKLMRHNLIDGVVTGHDG